ncbi:MAG: SDR family NAD(P)-dependent oxidoreductase [Chitinophagaceae bacterium]|nr:SDR family NAD(P)-dependent oxidoreductase [Chitinophagaceae bacterium]
MNKRQTALVTGSGQGIGYALAKACAMRDIDVLLVSLPGEDLQARAAALKQEHNITAHYFETDLSQPENCQALYEYVINNNIPVNILINNAGIGSSGPFEDFSTQFYSKQVALNVAAPVLLTRLFIPLLKQQPQSYILYTGSLGGFFNMPNKEVYGASKAFILSFSKALRNRWEGSNISISVVCPGPVDSNARLLEIHKNLKGIAKKSVMTPDEVAAIAIPAMLAGKKVIIPGNINKLFLFLNRLVPQAIQLKIIRKEMERQAKMGVKK